MCIMGKSLTNPHTDRTGGPHCSDCPAGPPKRKKKEMPPQAPNLAEITGSGGPKNFGDAPAPLLHPEIGTGPISRLSKTSICSVHAKQYGSCQKYIPAIKQHHDPNCTYKTYKKKKKNIYKKKKNRKHKKHGMMITKQRSNATPAIRIQSSKVEKKVRHQATNRGSHVSKIPKSPSSSSSAGMAMPGAGRSSPQPERLGSE